jgi:hypothetical protein
MVRPVIYRPRERFLRDISKRKTILDNPYRSEGWKKLSNTCQFIIMKCVYDKWKPGQYAGTGVKTLKAFYDNHFDQTIRQIRSGTKSMIRDFLEGYMKRKVYDDPKYKIESFREWYRNEVEKAFTEIEVYLSKEGYKYKQP